MSKTNRATFGKLNSVAVRGKTATTAAPRRTWLIWALAGTVACLGAAGVLSLTSAFGSRSGTAPIEVAAFPLTGLWAANGQSCRSARTKIEFDDATAMSVSALGRLPIGAYEVSGTNPVYLTLGKEQLVWEPSSDGNTLTLISASVDKDSTMAMMHLTRC